MTLHNLATRRTMQACRKLLPALVSAVILTGASLTAVAAGTPTPAQRGDESAALPSPTPTAPNAASPQGVVMAAAVAGLPAAAVSVPITLDLGPGIMVATLDLTLSVAPLNGAPSLTRAVSFNPAAALPAPDVLNLVANDTVQIGWHTALTPPLAGTLQLGVLEVRLPLTAPGQEYDVDVTDLSATSADGSGLALAGVSGHIGRCSLLVTGEVTDASSSRPVVGASVCFSGGAVCVQSDANGFFGDLCFAGESSAGTYVCASAPTYAPSCQGPWTPGGYGVTVTFALVPQGSLTATPTPTPPATGCVGDCDGSGTVDIAELLRGVNIGLGLLPPAACPAFNCSAACGPGPHPLPPASITCLLRAVANALTACPPPQCVSDADCDDGNDCTIDQCTAKGCTHGCVCL